MGTILTLLWRIRLQLSLYIAVWYVSVLYAEEEFTPPSCQCQNTNIITTAIWKAQKGWGCYNLLSHDCCCWALMVNRDTQEGERCVRFSGICIDSTCFSPITCQYWDVKVSPPHWMDNTLSLTLGDLRPQSVSLPPSVCWSILECSRQRVKNAMN